MIDAVRGVLRVRKWPRKRGTPTSAAQLWWIDWFKQANLLAKYADAASQIRSKQMTKGSGLYPRDVLLAAMRGKLYTWADQDGWKWYPMAARTDISESLDVLAQTIGSVLVRAADFWKAPTPGAIGDALTYRGGAAEPTWSPAAGSWAAGGGCLLSKTGAQAIPDATKTPVDWDAQEYDTKSIHDPASNPSRMTVPAGFTQVQLTTCVRFQRNTNGRRETSIEKNGAAFPGMPEEFHQPQIFVPFYMNVTSPVLEVSPGDYFEVMVWQNSGGSLNIQNNNRCWAALHLIG